VPAPATDQLVLDLGAAAPRAPIDLRPMLPRAVAELPSDGRHLRDLHWGGLRTLAHLRPDGTRLIVGGRDVTAAFPEVVAALAGVAPPGTILDGELVVPDAAGRLDRPALRGRLRGSRAVATATATLVVSDLPWLAGSPLLAQPLRVRRQRLAALHLAGDHLVVPAPLAGAAGALLAVIRERGLEGVTAKRLDSPYLPGVRSRLWRLARATPRSAELAPLDEAVATGVGPLLALLRTLPLGEEP
jgi:bifunctional non-homologous end joining protein LigD